MSGGLQDAPRVIARHAPRFPARGSASRVALGLVLALVAAPVLEGARMLGLDLPGGIRSDDALIHGLATNPVGLLLVALLGVLGLTLLMHVARAIGRGHARLAKALLVHG